MHTQVPCALVGAESSVFTKTCLTTVRCSWEMFCCLNIDNKVKVSLLSPLSAVRHISLTLPMWLFTRTHRCLMPTWGAGSIRSCTRRTLGCCWEDSTTCRCSTLQLSAAALNWSLLLNLRESLVKISQIRTTLAPSLFNSISRMHNVAATQQGSSPWSSSFPPNCTTHTSGFACSIAAWSNMIAFWAVSPLLGNQWTSQSCRFRLMPLWNWVMNVHGSTSPPISPLFLVAAH